MKTVSFNKENTEHLWYVIDAQNVVLGRMATEIANRLRGKHKPEFTPHADTGDFVIVINADKVKVTGRKETDKIYYRYSGYPGGMKSRTFGDLRASIPARAIHLAVRGMLPKNRLSRALLKKLKVYGGESHPHEAQQPIPLAVQGRTTA
jgi:large subunit ribosomal protein L13